MKKRIIILAAVAIVAMAVTCFAIPFASQMDRTSATYPASGFSFKYFLNQTAATATIKIKAVPGGTEVASFAGTTARGMNTVAWDGTNNNAGGANVAEGDYTFEVAITGSEGAGWARIASNKTAASLQTAEYSTLPAGWPSRSVIVGIEPTQESYGIVFISTAATGGWLSGKNGIFLLNPDTSLYNDSVLYLNNDSMNAGYTDVWQTYWDPEDYTLWIAGQGLDTIGVQFHGAWNSPTSTNVTGDQITNLQDNRSVAVKGTGASRTLYICKTTQVWKYVIGTAPNLTGLTGTQILGLFSGAGWYSKSLRFDTAGNAYWIGRREAAASTAAHLERWNSATIDAAAADSLNDTNAAWNVQIGSGTGVDGGGIAIYKKNVADPNDDEIYVSLNTTAEAGVYYVGTAGEAAKTGTITDRKIDLSGVGTLSGYGCDIAADAVGNIYIHDGLTEVVYVYSPGGASSKTTPAPASKGFEVFGGTAVRSSWSLYQ